MARRNKQGGAPRHSPQSLPASRDSQSGVRRPLPDAAPVSGTGAYVWFHVVSLALVVLSMTPLTHNLDDIKVSEFLILGSVLAAWGVGLMASGRMPLPAGPVGWGLAAYWVAMIFSCLFSEFRWAGWHEILFTWGCIGFFFGGLAAGSSWPLLVRFSTAAVLLVLAVNLFGFFQYDLFGTGGTGMSVFYDAFYGDRVARDGPTAMQSLFYTFATEARTRLMSTALNRDFYAAFCLLYFPLAVSYTLLTRSRIRMAMGLTTALFTLISIFLCKSKGEYIFAAGAAVLYLTLFALAVRRIEVNIRYVWAWLAGVALVFLVFFWMNLPTLMGQLKDLRFSFSSREIIFAGAWGIFLDFPFLGGGPGTFKLYFPAHRRPDYFNHEISNVTELAHNYILNIMSETGLVGTLAFAVFGGSLAVIALRAVFRAEDSRLRLMLIAVVCGLFGMFGSNMTSTSGFWPIGAVGLWTFMGLLMGMSRQAEGWRPSPEWHDWAKPWVETFRRGWSRDRAPALRRWSAIAGLAIAVVAVLCLVLGSVRASTYWRSARAYNIALLDFERITRLYAAEANDPNLDPQSKARLADILKTAEANFLRCLEIMPAHVSAYYKLGSIYNMLANMEPQKHEEYLGLAKSTYEKLHTYAPDYAEIHYNLGVVNYRLGRLADKRIAQADKTGHADEAAKLAIARDEHIRLAKEFFERMKALSDKPEVYLNLGDTYIQGGQFDEAQKVLAEAVERYPSDDRFARNYYAASVKLGDPVGQIKGLRGMWLLTPGNRQYLYSALGLAMEHDRHDLFREIAELALERNPVDPIVFESMAREAQKRKDAPALADAAEKYARLVADPDMLRLLNESGGAKDEIILAGAEAADGLGDKARARKLYSALAPQASPKGEKARQWLQANPG